MARISTDGGRTIEHSSEHPRADDPGDSAGQQPVVENPENGSSIDESVVEVLERQPLAVRETGRLYRLKSARFVAVVAADTEEEARLLAATHDALRGDWRSAQFASAEFEDTGAAHVFGDVVFSALAAPFTPSRN
jgi:hypothetical protein